MRVEQLDNSVRAAGDAIVAAVVEAHRQDGPFVNRHLCNTRIGYIHLISIARLQPA